MPDQTDTELVRLARCGDHDALSCLLERHYAMCFRLAMVYMQNHADTEDVIQAAWLKVFRHLEQYNGESATFSTWLGSITINEALMALRTIRRQRSVAFADLPVRRRPCSRRPNPEALCAAAEWRELIRAEASRLPPLLRPVLIKDLYELSLPQVAKRLNLSIECAKSRLFRARAELRLRIERRLRCCDPLRYVC